MSYEMTVGGNSLARQMPKSLKKRLAAVDLVATSEMVSAAIKLDAQNGILNKGYSVLLNGAQVGQQVHQELEKLGPIAEPYIQALLMSNQAFAQAAGQTCQHHIDRVTRILPNGKGGF